MSPPEKTFDAAQRVAALEQQFADLQQRIVSLEGQLASVRRQADQLGRMIRDAGLSFLQMRRSGD